MRNRGRFEDPDELAWSEYYGNAGTNTGERSIYRLLIVVARTKRHVIIRRTT